MLKKIFILICKTRWLRVINREIAKHRKLKDKCLKQTFIINHLVEEYNEKFNENLGGFKND